MGTNLQRLLLLSFVSIVNHFIAVIPIFDPPNGWECALPAKIAPCIQVGFIGKGSTLLKPSINLAIEEVDVNLNQYLKAVKEIHLGEPGTNWRDLGKFTTRTGAGRLTEITTSSPLGEIRMLQMIVVKNNTAYILTGAAIKEDFLRFQETFIKSFQSLRLEKDLFSPLSETKKKEFERFFSSLDSDTFDETKRAERWKDLEKMVLAVDGLGDHWRFLMLKTGREKMYSQTH